MYFEEMEFMMQKKGFIIALIVLLCIVLGVGGYMYYKRTPTYSLNIIKESVEKHDFDTFSRHVDTENIISCAYDDLLDIAMEDSGTDQNIKGLGSGFAKMLKPNIVSALNDEIKQFVKNGNTTSDDTQDSKNKKAGEQQAGDNIKKKMDIDNVVFKSIKDSRTDGDFTIVGIEVTDKRLKHNFVIELKMLQLDDGTWKITKISNLKGFIKEIEKVTKEKLAELNKPIQDEINSKISLQSPTAEIVNSDPWGISKTLKLTIPAKFNTDKHIVRIEGNIKAQTPSNENFDMPYAVSVDSSKVNTNIEMGYHLNMFMSHDADMMKNGISGYTFSIDINKIVYEDKTTLELKKELD